MRGRGALAVRVSGCLWRCLNRTLFSGHRLHAPTEAWRLSLWPIERVLFRYANRTQGHVWPRSTHPRFYSRASSWSHSIKDDDTKGHRGFISCLYQYGDSHELSCGFLRGFKAAGLQVLVFLNHTELFCQPLNSYFDPRFVPVPGDVVSYDVCGCRAS